MCVFAFMCTCVCVCVHACVCEHVRVCHNRGIEPDLHVHVHAKGGSTVTVYCFIDRELVN